MDNLEEMLKSFQGMVDDHQKSEPLLNANTYASDRKLGNRDAGDIFVGCIGLWIDEKRWVHRQSRTARSAT
jgi:hypothetical protein